MEAVGIRELKERTSEVIRRVREEGETIDVTYRGEIVAQIIPVRPRRPDPEELAAFWEDWDRFAEELSTRWPKGVSAVDAVRDVRRDL